MKEKWPQDNKNLLWQYAGLAFQLVASLGIAVFIGFKLDGCIQMKFPLLVWLLPLIVIIALIIKTIRDTSRKN